MTKEQVDEVIAAYRAGKTVIRHKDCGETYDYSLCDGCNWLAPPIEKGEEWSIKPEPEGGWVVRDAELVANAWMFKRNKEGPWSVISFATSLPGFGGIEYEGWEGFWHFASPRIQALPTGEFIIAKPLRVRFWVEGGAE
jgi:hypothetical protein